MIYNQFRYIFPPRPKNAIPPKDLVYYDDQGGFLGQPKIDGSNCVIFTNGIELKIMNRHGQVLSGVTINSEISALFRGNIGNWIVLNGEYLNKAKKDESGISFNHKLIIFDILVYDSEYLLGKTFLERVELLDNIYGSEDSDKDYLHSISENIFRVKTYTDNFSDKFNHLSKIDMVEGLVLKRSKAKLEFGSSSDNNSKSQLKCRKPTKNFKF